MRSDKDNLFIKQNYNRYRNVVDDMVNISSTKHLMKGHMEVDVTYAKEVLRQNKTNTGVSQSFTAWFIKCVAQAIVENKQIQAMRKRNKIIIFDDIDVFVLIETNVNNNQFAIPYVIRVADKKSCKEIHKGIRAAQKQSVHPHSIMIGNESVLLRIYPYIPKVLRLFICRK